jgi:hypothetical protein
MNEYLPIEIRHLDSLTQSLSSANLVPVVVGDESEGFETKRASLLDILNYINLENQDLNIQTLNLSNSASVAGGLYVGNVTYDPSVKMYVDGNMVISGALSALQGVTFFSTNVEQTTSMFINGASGTALTVRKNFEYPIAQFFDGSNIALHIDGSSERAGNVGINTDTPIADLTVNGDISAYNIIYSFENKTDYSQMNYASAGNLETFYETKLGKLNNSYTSIGNISSSNIDINGNVYVNTLSPSSSNTYIGNSDNLTYVNSDLIIKNLSASGNIFINNQVDETYILDIGNVLSTNTIKGTNTLSGSNYLEGDVYLNNEGIYSTYINSLDNTGNVYIGNNLNKVFINSKELIANTTLSGQIIRQDYSEYESLTAALGDLFANADNVVLSGLSLSTELTGVTSLRYSLWTQYNALNINLPNRSITLGDNIANLNVNANSFILNGKENLSLKTAPGANIIVGNSDTSFTVDGYVVNINNTNDGVKRLTHLNTFDETGDVYIGNSSGIVDIKGKTYINTLSTLPNDTYIGNASSTVTIYNPVITGSLFDVAVPTLKIDNIITDNLITSNNPAIFLAGFNSLQNSAVTGNLKITDKLILQSGVLEGNLFTQGQISATNLNINGWDLVYTEFQISSAAWGTGGVAQQLIFDANTNTLSQSYGNEVSLWPLIINAKNYIGSEFVTASGADVSSNNFTLTGGVNVIGSFSQGNKTLATGDYSFASGFKTTAAGDYSQAKGTSSSTGEKVLFSSYYYPTRTFSFSPETSAKFAYVTPGYKLRAYEGDFLDDVFGVTIQSRDPNNGDIIIATDPLGRNSFNGYLITNSGTNAHAEGNNTTAAGVNSHAEGNNTYAVGADSHASGTYSIAQHDRSWIWRGNPSSSTFSTTKTDQFVINADNGVYVPSSVGINTDNNQNALTVNGTISANSTAFFDNVIISGTLQALGQTSIIETEVTITSSLEITNIGSGPALKVIQTGEEPVAHFYDGENVAFVINDNIKIGIGLQVPVTTLHLSGSDALVIPVGDSSQRVNVKGAIRYNDQEFSFEGFDGNVWGSLGGVKDTDQNTYISAEDYPGADNNQIKFFVSGIEKAIIQPDGKIGIGTIDPNEILTVSGNISANNNLFIQSLTSFEDSKFNKNLEVTNNLTVSNVFNLSAVTFTGEVYTNVTSITAQNQFIKVIADGQTKYIRLYDIE